MSKRDRGQVLPVLVLVLVLVGGAVLLLGRVAEASMERGRARTAADAAALAGAAEGEPAARAAARANGARLVRFERRGSTVWVTVAHARAVARATAEKTRWVERPRTPITAGAHG